MPETNAAPTQAISVLSTRPDLRLNRPLASLTKAEAVEAAERYRRALLPADTDAAIIPLSRLSVHYWQPDRPQEHWTVIIEDFRSGLSRFPLDLIEDGCRKWREATIPPNKFFPKPGELYALIEPTVIARRSTLATLTQIAEREPDTPPPSEEQKAAVSKIIAEGLPEIPGFLKRRSAKPAG